jgi:membrane-associated PAP2 superfamily phosphatase
LVPDDEEAQWKRGFWLRHAVLPALAFLALALVFDRTDLDLRISDRWYDFGTGRWIHGDAWWANALIHEGGRDLVVLILLACFVALVASIVSRRIRRWRQPAAYLALSIVLTTGLVGLGKSVSPRHCPRALERYGGTAPHLGLFDCLPEGAKAGHCFPAGHSSGDFALVALYFVFRRRRRFALAGLGFGLCLGSLYGFGQLVRGAHFVSHDLYSAAIAWFVALGLCALLLRTPPSP